MNNPRMVRIARAALSCALLAASPAWTEPDAPVDRAPTGTVRGRVVIANDSTPAPFAMVVALGTRAGTQTDETGAFHLSGVPAGRVILKVTHIGSPALLDTMDLVPGQTLERLLALRSPRSERGARTRDSLVALNHWPPRLDPTLDARMRAASKVRVFRLDSEPVYPPPDTIHFVLSWRIVGEVPHPSRSEVDALLAVFAHSELYTQDILGDVKACGGFQPGIAVRYLGNAPITELLLCYKCGEFSIRSRDGVHQSGDFEGEGESFARFAKKMFPRDPEIQKLGKPPEATPVVPVKRR